MSQHGPTRSVLLGVFVALLVLLVLTAVVPSIDLGVLSLPVALAIAFAKAALIFLFFMHLRYQRSGLVRLFAVSGFFWLGILGLLTFADYLTRS